MYDESHVWSRFGVCFFIHIHSLKELELITSYSNKIKNILHGNAKHVCTLVFLYEWTHQLHECKTTRLGCIDLLAPKVNIMRKMKLNTTRRTGNERAFLSVLVVLLTVTLTLTLIIKKNIHSFIQTRNNNKTHI